MNLCWMNGSESSSVGKLRRCVWVNEQKISVIWINISIFSQFRKEVEDILEGQTGIFSTSCYQQQARMDGWMPLDQTKLNQSLDTGGKLVNKDIIIYTTAKKKQYFRALYLLFRKIALPDRQQPSHELPCDS